MWLQWGLTFNPGREKAGAGRFSNTENRLQQMLKGQNRKRGCGVPNTLIGSQKKYSHILCSNVSEIMGRAEGKGGAAQTL
jgi:hypothetical protein